MKAPFDRPYKFSVIFTHEEQIKFVQVINNIKSNALKYTPAAGMVTVKLTD